MSLASRRESRETAGLARPTASPSQTDIRASRETRGLGYPSALSARSAPPGFDLVPSASPRLGGAIDFLRASAPPRQTRIFASFENSDLGHLSAPSVFSAAVIYRTTR
jgi:hypothetical protein